VVRQIIQKALVGIMIMLVVRFALDAMAQALVMVVR
jgi:hypothetical protein